MESKKATRNILVGIGVERLRNRAYWLIRDDFIYIAGLKNHVQRLAVNLERIQALLPDAEKKGADCLYVWSWLKRVSAVSSEADILLDECCFLNLRSKLKAERMKPRKVHKFLPMNKVSFRAKLVWRTKGMSLKFKRLFRESFVLGISPDKMSVLSNLESDETSESSRMELLRVGEDFRIIKGRLITECPSQVPCLVQIIGNEGVENTNLARLLYDDDVVVKQFDIRIWIDVSGEFSILDTLKTMSSKLGVDVDGITSREAIKIKLMEKLRVLSFLLVLNNLVLGDDDALKWSSFMEILQHIGGSTSKRNKVLVTAPESKAIDAVSPFKHELTNKWSKQRDILIGEEGAPELPRILKMRKEIVARCTGNALLVRFIKIFMYSQKYENEWRKTAQEVYQVGNVPEEQVLDIMKLCYDHLPSLLLKQCFAFCCLFPKDTAIHKEELVQLWMVHGLLYPPKGRHLNMEDRGAKCLSSLMQHSFLEDSEDEFPCGKCCMMTGVLHDLATSISNDYCSIFEGIDVEDDFKAVHVTMIDCKLKRSEKLRGAFGKLRTLRLVNTGILDDILPYAKHLSALTVVNLAVEELPDSIGRLQYLKLLDVSKTRIVQLPDSITEICGLEALRLYDLEELPKNFQNLVNLRHLYVENFEDSGKLNFLPQKCYELIKHSSSKVSFKACLSNEFKIEELASLENPGRYSSLKIYRLENVKDKEEATQANLSRMERIDYVKLHWSGRRENRYDENVLEGLKPHTNIRHLALENFKGSRFPSWMVLLQNLVMVDFQGCCWCKNVPPLGHLPCLQVVKIQGMDNVKHISGEFYGSPGSGAAFPALTQLSLLGMASLEQWSVPKQRSAFPVLKILEVEQCPKLSALPDILHFHNNHLQRLRIAFCDRMTAIPQSLQNLEFLDDLDIRGLPSLLGLSITSFRCYKTLSRLTIGNIGNVDSSVKHLESGPRQVASLPAEIKCFSNLRYLAIWGYDGLEALPEWLVGFQSLHTLKLEFCKSLMYFPLAVIMEKLTNLEEISISYCPLLEERCSRGSRPEWHKISHIRRIVINNEDMKCQY